jgi:hypothetical protein
MANGIFLGAPPENLRETLLKGKSLECVADEAASSDEGSRLGWVARVEFLYRQTEAQDRQAQAAERAAKAQVRQAEAAERTAEASITSAKQMVRYTWYMFWTMIFIAVSTATQVVLAWRH